MSRERKSTTRTVNAVVRVGTGGRCAERVVSAENADIGSARLLVEAERERFEQDVRMGYGDVAPRRRTA